LPSFALAFSLNVHLTIKKRKAIMRNLLLLTAVFSFLALGSMQAQNCASSAKASAETKASCCAKTEAAAAQAAVLDASIEAREDAETGKVSYVRKDVCEKSGQVSFTAVEYCSKSAKFIDAAAGEQKPCVKEKEGKAAGAKATKVSNTSVNSEKAGCSGAAKKACAKPCAKAGA
jgi:hypothetical protein